MHDKGGGYVTQNSIVVCDTDAAYVEAFTSYLLEHLRDAQIYSFTSEEAFIASEMHYQIGILSADFLSVLEYSGKELVREKFYLCDEQIASEYQHLPMVYKYQSMEIVEELLHKAQQRTGSSWWKDAQQKMPRMVGVYSPISHELQLPFCLALCEIYREDGSVLFLDIEELSILQMFTHQSSSRSLLDLLYLVTQQEGEAPDLSEFISSFMGIDYIHPFFNPEELADVSKEHWRDFMRWMGRTGYDTIVILFGRAIPGFAEMMEGCEEMIVLGKPGDYYRKSQSRFLEYLHTNGIRVQVEEVMLPMSAGNLVDGTYVIEELIQGNLGLFVRKWMKQAQMLKGLSYGTA